MRHAVKTYTTIQGDMWNRIAYQQLGSTAHTDRLMNANLQYLSYYRFPAGIVLTLPEVPKKVSNSLPPWKRVNP